MSHERLFLDNLELIEGVITLICRRHHVSADEEDDFRSQAHMKLIDNDYAVLRKFQGRSSLRTYLTVVLERVFQDFRIAKWGKWRPSIEARRAGKVAVLLEQLVTRDRHTFDEAVEILRAKHAVTETHEALWAIFERLPGRIDRRPESEDALAFVPDPGPLPDAALEQAETEERRKRAYAALDCVLGRLELQERLIVKLRFYDGLGVVDIARLLQVDPKPLYRRFDQVLAKLRELLRVEGIDPSFLGEE